MSGYFWRNNGKLVGTPPGTLIRCNDCPCDPCPYPDYTLTASIICRYPETGNDYTEYIISSVGPYTDTMSWDGNFYYFSSCGGIFYGIKTYENGVETSSDVSVGACVYYGFYSNSLFDVLADFPYVGAVNFRISRSGNQKKLSGSGTTQGWLDPTSGIYYGVTYSFTPQSSANLQLLNNDEEFE